MNIRQLKAKRRPFWLPASSFYFLVVGFSAASFFLVLWVMQDAGSEPEIIVGGLIASSVLISGVVIRELLLRNARERFIAQRNQLDANLKSASENNRGPTGRKLTLEWNAAAIGKIRSKSDAAMVFEKIAQGHREVFELCAEYRKLVASEIQIIHPNSPRLKALIKGNEYALKTHRFHVLRWAELESKTLAAEAHRKVDQVNQADYIERAKRPLEVALSHYPDESALRDSLDVLEEMLLTMRVRECISDAELAVSNGDHETAVSIYQKALNHLNDDVGSRSNADLRRRIEKALELYED